MFQTVCSRQVRRNFLWNSCLQIGLLCKVCNDAVRETLASADISMRQSVISVLSVIPDLLSRRPISICSEIQFLFLPFCINVNPERELLNTSLRR